MTLQARQYHLLLRSYCLSTNRAPKKGKNYDLSFLRCESFSCMLSNRPFATVGHVTCFSRTH